MAKRKIYLDEISVDYSDVNSNPYFNQQNYAKVEEPKKKVNNSYKPSKTTKNSSVGSSEYAVQKGDSLWKIAKEHGTTVEALRAANPEIKGNMIYPNQIINLGTNTKIPNVKIVVDKIIDNNVTDNKRQSLSTTPPIQDNSGTSYYNKVSPFTQASDEGLIKRKTNTTKQSNTKSTKNATQIRRDNIVKRTNERQEQVHKYDRKFTLKDIKPKISQRVQLKPVVITAKGTPRKETNWDYLGLKR